MSTIWVNLVGPIADSHHSPTEPGGVLEAGRVLDVNLAGQALGIVPGMTKREALSFAPQLKLASLNPDRCVQRMHEWLEIARLYTDEIESTGFSSAYLSLDKHPDPVDIAQLFLNHLERRFAYPYQAGISPTKWVAKALADFPMRQAPLPGFSLAPLSVQVLTPLEPAVRERLRFLGYKRVRDVQALSVQTLYAQFGTLAHHILAVANGSNHEPVETNYPPASVTATLPFEGGISDYESIKAALADLSARLMAQLASCGRVAKGCALTIHTEDDHACRSMRQAKPFRGSLGLQLALLKCFDELSAQKPTCSQPIFKFTVTLPDLVAASPKQRAFIGKDAAFAEDALESVRHKYGRYSVHSGKEHKEPRRVHVLREWARVSGWQ